MAEKRTPAEEHAAVTRALKKAKHIRSVRDATTSTVVFQPNVRTGGDAGATDSRGGPPAGR